MKIEALSDNVMVWQQRDRSLPFLRACVAALTVVLLCLALTAQTAHARSVQWIWKNEQGVKVYSDMPPPAHISGRNILKSPHRAVVQRRARAVANSGPVGLVDAKVARGEAQSEADEAGAKDSADGKTKEVALESELDKKVALKREQEEAAKKAKAKQEQARLEQEERERREKQEQNCRRIEESRRNLSSGARVSTTDAKGERRFLSEQEIQGRLDRLDEAAQANDC